jgi:hypothetical protein
VSRRRRPRLARCGPRPVLGGWPHRRLNRPPARAETRRPGSPPGCAGARAELCQVPEQRSSSRAQRNGRRPPSSAFRRVDRRKIRESRSRAKTARLRRYALLIEQLHRVQHTTEIVVSAVRARASARQPAISCPSLLAAARADDRRGDFVVPLAVLAVARVHDTARSAHRSTSSNQITSRGLSRQARGAPHPWRASDDWPGGARRGGGVSLVCGSYTEPEKASVDTATRVVGLQDRESEPASTSIVLTVSPEPVPRSARSRSHRAAGDHGQARGARADQVASG